MADRGAWLQDPEVHALDVELLGFAHPEDHAFVLDDGAIVYSGPARELAADDARVQALAGASAEEWTHS